MATITSANFNEDIFGRAPLIFGGAFAADNACVNLGFTVGGQSVTGLLVQQMSIQYNQPVTRLYDVGSQYTYFVAGRPQGTVGLTRVLGPSSILTEIYEQLGDVCNANLNDLCFCLESGCASSQAPVSMDMCIKNVVIQSLGFSVAAQDMMINEQMSLFFTSLLVATGTGCVCSPQSVQCACFDELS